jgi:torulene dioxygenase
VFPTRSSGINFSYVMRLLSSALTQLDSFDHGGDVVRVRYRNNATPTQSSAYSDSYSKRSFSLPEIEMMELPTVDPRCYHKKYRYAYGISIGGGKEAVVADQLIKLDMDHPRISSPNLADGGIIWREERCVPGEPIIVPDPNGTEEDDGVILSIVLVGKLAKSMLVVLNAKDMTELGRAEMETAFPIGFHGVFV